MGLAAPSGGSSGGGGGGGFSLGAMLNSGLNAIQTTFGGLQQGVLHAVDAVDELAQGHYKEFGRSISRAGLVTVGGIGGAMLGGVPGAILGGSAGHELGNFVAGQDDTLDAADVLMGGADKLDSGILGHIENFGLNVASDPAVFLSGGVEGAAGEGASLGSKAAARGIGIGVPGLSKLSLVDGTKLVESGEALRGSLRAADSAALKGRAGDLISGAKTGVSTLFSPDASRVALAQREGIAAADAPALNDTYKTLTSHAQAAGTKYLENFQETAQKLADQSGVTAEDLPRILHDVETGSNASDPLVAHLSSIRQSGSDQLSLLGDGAVQGALPTRQGLRLIMRDPSVVDLADRSAMKQALSSGKGLDIPSKWGSTTAEANANLAEHFGAKADILGQNPFEQSLNLARRGAESRGTDTFTSGLQDLPEESQGALRAMQDSRPGTYFPDPGGMSQKWKTLATSSPAFHNRNIFGDLTKVMPEGTSVRDLVTAMRDSRAVRKIPGESIADDGLEAAAQSHLSPDQFARWSQSRDEAVQGSAYFHTDMSSRGVTYAGDESKLKSAAAYPFRKMRAYGERSQDMIRDATFQAQLRKSGDAATAARDTKNLLIDYSDNTPFTAALRKGPMPFATFAVKNTPVSIAQGLRRPALAALPLHARQQLVPELDLPDTQIEAAGKVLSPLASLAPGYHRGEGGNLRLTGKLLADEFGGAYAGLPLAAVESNASQDNGDLITKVIPLGSQAEGLKDPHRSVFDNATRLAIGIKPTQKEITSGSKKSKKSKVNGMGLTVR